MKINKKINDKILKLWRRYTKESGRNSPLLYPEFKQNKILFIGLNPSLSEKAFNTIANKKNSEKEEDYKNISFGELFNKENLKKYQDKLIKMEKLAREKYSFFTKFKEICEDFEHIDLFLYRLTSQKDFKKKIGIDKKKIKGEEQINIEDNFKDFVEEQLKLASDLIQLLKPKIIIVANAFASDIINHYWELFKLNKSEEEFSKKGYDTITTENEEIPIIFTSMLTQQRALDNHTFKRLKWQIKKILENQCKK